MKHKVQIEFEIDPTTQGSTDTAHSAIQIVHALLNNQQGIERIKINCEGLERVIDKSNPNMK
jgi:hypothetical protein